MKKESKIISIRVSNSELEIIQTRASQAGQSVSRYLVENAICDHGITNSVKQSIFYSLCKIKDYAQQDNNYETTKECNTIWQLLK